MHLFFCFTFISNGVKSEHSLFANLPMPCVFKTMHSLDFCNTVRNKNVSTCLSNTLKQVDKCFLKILWLQETEIHL